MNPCEACAIDDKIFECCGRFPETGETAVLTLDDSRKIVACPYLEASGKCRIYDHRPLACQTHFCAAYDHPRSMTPDFQSLARFFPFYPDQNSPS